MNRSEYNEIETFMLEQMRDSAHDRYHVYRVLNSTLDIAYHEDTVDFDVLLAAGLLHDIGREKQFSNPELCHALVGGDMAYEFLISRKWPEHKALHVKDCIATHRYRKKNKPQSIEAKILFDADKLEASGAIGIARTLIYGGQVTEPLYILDESGNIRTGGGGAEISSFMQEYNYKLKNIYGAFYTRRAKEIAAARQKTAVDFYNGLFAEIYDNNENGIKKHGAIFDD